MGEQRLPEKGKGPGRYAAPLCTESLAPLSTQLQPVKMCWVPLYVFDVSFDLFFFVLELNNIIHSFIFLTRSMPIGVAGVCLFKNL